MKVVSFAGVLVLLLLMVGSASAALGLKLENSESPITYDHIGQIITYTYKMANSGDVKISGPVAVIDNKIGTFRISANGLAPGATVNVKATYRITASDLKKGSVTNLAYATGMYNKRRVISNTVSRMVNTDQKHAIVIEKSASPTTYSYSGQIITYMYKVTNSSEAKFSGPITVTDNKTGTFTISVGDLEPGAVVNGQSTYKITDQDLQNGSVTNLAYATGSMIVLANTADPAINGTNIVGCSRKKITSNEAKVTINLHPTTNVPEFPSIVLPVITVVGMIFILGRKKR